MARLTSPLRRSQPELLAPRRPLRRSLLLGMALAGCLLVLSGACIPDLPEPLSCPPEPRIAGTECTSALVDVQPGCFERPRMECLTGPRTTCECVPNECPGTDACFADGGCPESVGQEVAGDIECLSLRETDIGAGEIPGVTQCLCGCYGCAAMCDGYGPVIGSYTPAGTQAPFVFISLNDMPDSGRLGLYLRTRGIGSLTVGVLRGTIQDQVWTGPFYFAPTPLGTRFTDEVLFDNGVAMPPSLDGLAYTWTTPEEKPTLVVLTPDIDPESETVAMLEIDCVVPFVVELSE